MCGKEIDCLTRCIGCTEKRCLECGEELIKYKRVNEIIKICSNPKCFVHIKMDKTKSWKKI